MLRLVLVALAGIPLSLSVATPTPMFTYADSRIAESSGLAASSFDDTFYTHNDSGDFARFFRVDAHGKTVAVYTLRGAENVDWEDMAAGVDVAGHGVLYFGDIGDNDRQRKEIAVYVVLEPRGPSSDVAWTKLRFAYPDGPHDAEALLVDPRTHRIFVATKSLLGEGAMYEAPAVLDSHGLNMLARVGSVPPLTTSASFSPDGLRVVLLSYLGAFWANDAMGGWPRFDLPLPPQAEAISYTHDGSSVLVGGEGVHSPVYEVGAPGLSTVAPEPRPDVSAAPSVHVVTSKSDFPAAVVVVVAIVGLLAVSAAFLALRKRGR